MVEKIKVAVIGASGKMGSETVKAINDDDDMELVAEINRDDPLEKMVAAAATVVVEFTAAGSSFDNVMYAVGHNKNVVVGTSGWKDDQQAVLRQELERYPDVGVLIAPNFAIGSVLATYFAQLAAPYFESAEIIELHHPQKIDAPSATAIKTAQDIASARVKAQCAAAPDSTIKEVPGARGARISDIPVHSVRLQGLVAHQEVLFGSGGEGLSIRHDSWERKSFMPGVLLGVRQVRQRPGLTVGLENYLNFSGGKPPTKK